MKYNGEGPESVLQYMPCVETVLVESLASLGQVGKHPRLKPWRRLLVSVGSTDLDEPMI